MAEGPRDVLSVEILQLNIPFKNQSPEPFVWHYLQTDGQTTGQTHDDGLASLWGR